MGRKRKSKEVEAEAPVAAVVEAEAEAPAVQIDDEAEAEAEGVYPEKGYKVADGRSISTGGNVIGEGQPVEPADIHPNEKVAAENFDRLLNDETIVRA